MHAYKEKVVRIIFRTANRSELQKSDAPGACLIRNAEFLAMEGRSTKGPQYNEALIRLQKAEPINQDQMAKEGSV